MPKPPLQTTPAYMTPQQAALHQFTSKSPIREVLSCVYTDGQRAVATDSFRLVEVVSHNTAAKPLLIKGASLKAAKVKSLASLERIGKLLLLNAQDTPSTVLAEPDPNTTPDEFPKYDQIFPTGEYIEVCLNGQLLADIAAYLSKFDRAKKITMQIYETEEGKFKPVVFLAEGEGQKARALLMPRRD